MKLWKEKVKSLVSSSALLGSFFHLVGLSCSIFSFKFFVFSLALSFSPFLTPLTASAHFHLLLSLSARLSFSTHASWLLAGREILTMWCSSVRNMYVCVIYVRINFFLAIFSFLHFSRKFRQTDAWGVNWSRINLWREKVGISWTFNLCLVSHAVPPRPSIILLKLCQLLVEWVRLWKPEEIYCDGIVGTMMSIVRAVLSPSLSLSLCFSLSSSPFLINVYFL